MYCDIDRSASSAAVWAVDSTVPARASAAIRRQAGQPAGRRPLWQVLEALNDDLDVLLRRVGRVAEVVQVHPHALRAGRGDARREFVPRHEIGGCRAAAAAGAE